MVVLGDNSAYPSFAVANSLGDIIATGALLNSFDFGGGIRNVTGSIDLFIVKYAGQTGGWKWDKTYSNTTFDGYPLGLAVDANDGVYLLAEDDTFSLRKLDADGNEQFLVPFPRGSDLPKGPAVDKAGDVVIAGSLSFPRDFGGGSQPGPLFVVKYTSSGTHSYSTSLPGYRVAQVAVDGRGNTVLVGSTSAATTIAGTLIPMGSFVVKLSPTLVPLWARPLVGGSSELGLGGHALLAIGQHGRVFVAGNLKSGQVVGLVDPAITGPGIALFALGAGGEYLWSSMLSDGNAYFWDADLDHMSCTGTEILITGFYYGASVIGGQTLVDATGIGNAFVLRLGP